MRRPVVNFATQLVMSAGLRAALIFLCFGGSLHGQEQSAAQETASPAAGNTPANKAKSGKKPRTMVEESAGSSAAKAHKAKEIFIPLPIKESAKELKLPQNDPQTGNLLSMLKAVKVTRTDEEHLALQEMNLDLYKPDGKEDFHIIVPASVFNLSSRVITSDQPVLIKTQDFELTGERMEFNTVDREGRLFGKVRMLVHNLKPNVGGMDTATKPE